MLGKLEGERNHFHVKSPESERHKDRSLPFRGTDDRNKKSSGETQQRLEVMTSLEKMTAQYVKILGDRCQRAMKRLTPQYPYLWGEGKVRRKLAHGMPAPISQLL